MGQAKNRGSFEERKAQAIATGNRFIKRNKQGEWIGYGKKQGTLRGEKKSCAKLLKI